LLLGHWEDGIVSARRTYADEVRTGAALPGQAPGMDHVPVLGAVREDIRQTLRMGWIDPVFDALSAHPAFLTAGWSSARPNVGRSFLSLAKAVREEAVTSLKPMVGSFPLVTELQPRLSDEELRRVEQVSRAVHLATSKVQLVVHALFRAARRERIPGTGREEPPIRRGVPEWQRWMASQPVAEASVPILDESARAYSLSAAPTPLRLMARWPDALSSLWNKVRAASGDDHWKDGAHRVRRMALRGMGSFPHPVELQWVALRERGLGEDERLRLMRVLRAHAASTASVTMMAAFAWLAMGSPEIGAEA